MPEAELWSGAADALKSIHDELQRAPRMPDHEGQERLFRTLLRDKLMTHALRWPPEKMINGEFLDLMGFDSINYLVVYVETKTPRRAALAGRDIAQFEAKLREQGTCEAGLVTNGHRLVSYTCSTTARGIELTKTADIDVDELVSQMNGSGVTSNLQANLSAALEPLRAERYVGASAESCEKQYGRVRPSSERPGDTRELSHQLAAAIDTLKPVLVDALRTLLVSRIPVGATDATGFVILDPLDDWSTYSGRVPPSTIEKYLVTLVAGLLASRVDKPITSTLLRREAKTATRKLGVTIRADLISELVAGAIATPAESESKIRDVLLDLIVADHLGVFAAQTAYVMLNRLLLYRVAEDRGLVSRKLSGVALDRCLNQENTGLLDWYLRASALRNLVDEAQQLVEAVFYSHLYVHGLFDWWEVPAAVRSGYDPEQEAVYRRLLREIDIALEKCVRILNRFELGRIDRDIWKDIYQEYLPPKERSRLGGFYTPDAIVDLILDLSGYTKDAPVCRSMLLDPACGSGAFIVEAGKRLRAHLERPAECHSELDAINDRRERAWRILRRMIADLHGIDIHPFACFLTEMNFLLANVDLLLEAKKIDPSRRITELNIGCDDSLRPSERQVQLRLSQFMGTNSRARQMVEDRQKAKIIKETQFDFVVGNPPWSGVLRGELSPLFDEGAKQAYSEYDSAIDKYDIYTLFIERGIDWLTPKGKLGYITQNRFLRRRYGRGIRGYIKQHASLVACVDFWRTNRLIFPGRTNYPCVTILELRESGEHFPFIEVKATGRRLVLEELVERVTDALRHIEPGSDVDTQYLVGYSVPQSVVRQNPDKPWDLTPSSVSELQRRLLRMRNCLRLDSVFSLCQGVTPGGGSLQVYLMNSVNAIEPEVSVPAVEAEDITRWKLDPPRKWLIYPYTDDGRPVDLGDLNFDLNDNQARRQVDSLIAKGAIVYPRAAKRLVEHYSLLASRQAEKQTWQDFGKRWYEYHRSRNPLVMKARPKILTRRMSRELMFALDHVGLVPTDSCISLTLLPESKWLRASREAGLTDADSLAFCLAILNSTLTKFLLLSRADAWQGGFYQVREDSLGQVPILLPTKGRLGVFSQVVAGAHAVLDGRSDASPVDKAVIDAYGLTPETPLMASFIAAKIGLSQAGR